MKIYVVMGVSGCGKSTVAKALAARRGGLYWDADDFHSADNKAKMASGVALDDDDRWAWLGALNARLRQASATGKDVFLACSALREVYRSRLSEGLQNVLFVYLRGTEETIAARLQTRAGHFMNPALLRSQFQTLEEPEHAVVVEIDGTAEEVLERAMIAISGVTAPVFVPS